MRARQASPDLPVSVSGRVPLRRPFSLVAGGKKQCPLTFQITVTMDGYTHKLKEAPARNGQDRSPLSDAEKKWVASVGGQLNWMARQGRADLAYGISRVQQMAGARDPETIKLLNQLVKKAREPNEMIFKKLPGDMGSLAFLAVSDASHGSMPKGKAPRRDDGLGRQPGDPRRAPRRDVPPLPQRGLKSEWSVPLWQRRSPRLPKRWTSVSMSALCSPRFGTRTLCFSSGGGVRAVGQRSWFWNHPGLVKCRMGGGGG